MNTASLPSFSIMWLKENQNIKLKRGVIKIMKLDSYLTPLTKINSKWIRDLNIRSATVKFSEDNIEKIILTLVWPMIFFKMTPKARQQKQK